MQQVPETILTEICHSHAAKWAGGWFSWAPESTL